MADTDEIESRIEQLESELGSSVDTVQYADRMVRKKTNAATIEAIDYFQRKRTAAGGGRSRQIRVRAAEANGF